MPVFAVSKQKYIGSHDEVWDCNVAHWLLGFKRHFQRFEDVSEYLLDVRLPLLGLHGAEDGCTLAAAEPFTWVPGLDDELPGADQTLGHLLMIH